MWNGYQVVAQTQSRSFLRFNYFAGQYQLTRALLTDDKWQKHGCHWWKHTKFYFGLSELGSLRSYDDVACSDEFASPSECGSINHSDCGLRNLIQQTKDLMERVEHLEDCVLGMIFDCNTGAESPAFFICFKNNSHQLTVRQFSKNGRNLAHHWDVENI